MKNKIINTWTVVFPFVCFSYLSESFSLKHVNVRVLLCCYNT